MRLLKRISIKSSITGFTLIEVLLASAIFSLLAVGLIGAISYGQTSTVQSGDRARAIELADEGLQATRNIADANYGNLAVGTYGLAQSGNVWTFSGISDTTGIFTRQITITSGGTNRLILSATVSWTPLSGGTSQYSTATELTNWTANTKSWLNAILAGSCQPTGRLAGVKVFTVGNYAYVVRAGGNPNFFICNISNPASPTLVGTLKVASNPTNVFVSGNYAYLSTSSSTNQLQIINISNPASPSITSSFNAPGKATALAVFISGNYAYLTREANGGNAEFAIVNVSNPASPTLAGSYANNIAMNAIYVSGNYAYVGTNSTSQGLLVINITVPAVPALLTSYTLNPTTPVNALVASGTNLLIAQGSTLTSYAAANPLSITKTSSVGSSGAVAINGIAIDPTNTYAFLATDSTTAPLQIVNITNLAAMSVVKTVALGSADSLNGVSYDTANDVVVGVGTSSSQEVATFVKN